MRCYVAGAIIPWINPDCADQEYWGADLRNVTVLFVNLGLREHDLLAAAAYDDAMKRCHDVLIAVQVQAFLLSGCLAVWLSGCLVC